MAKSSTAKISSAQSLTTELYSKSRKSQRDKEKREQFPRQTTTQSLPALSTYASSSLTSARGYDSRTVISLSKKSKNHSPQYRSARIKPLLSTHQTAGRETQQEWVKSGPQLQKYTTIKPLPITSQTFTYNENPLSRLSEQLKVSKREKDRMIPAQPTYQPFKTLNTKTLLAPITDQSSLTAGQILGKRTFSNISNDKSHNFDVGRTLNMPSEYETHIDRMKKVCANARGSSFAEQHYSSQDWLHKERGGPITRKYEESGQPLLQRYRALQKIYPGENYSSLARIEKTFQFQQQCKDTLQTM